ncbi:MAG: hypothetical protein ACR2NP_08475 [Pirellulaceae bacterium]
MNSENRFELRNGEQPLLGEFAINGDLLQMQDDAGEQIDGQIRFDSDAQFILTVNGNEMVFVRS